MNLDDSLILIKAELSCVEKYKDSDPQTAYIHLERAKNEIQKAEYAMWHKFHTSPATGTAGFDFGKCDRSAGVGVI